MKPLEECCGQDPDIELNYDLDECSISCPKCNRSVVKRTIEDCKRAWNAEAKEVK